MSPSAIFLALFLRSQLTNTMALGLIFVPKLWYQHKQVSRQAEVEDVGHEDDDDVDGEEDEAEIVC